MKTEKPSMPDESVEGQQSPADVLRTMPEIQEVIEPDEYGLVIDGAPIREVYEACLADGSISSMADNVFGPLVKYLYMPTVIDRFHVHDERRDWRRAFPIKKYPRAWELYDSKNAIKRTPIIQVLQALDVATYLHLASPETTARWEQMVQPIKEKILKTRSIRVYAEDHKILEEDPDADLGEDEKYELMSLEERKKLVEATRALAKDVVTTLLREMKKSAQ